MSRFANGRIYIIVNTKDITEEMLNNVKISFNSDMSTLRASNDGRTLMKIKTPVSAVFNGYRWYNHDEIRAELGKAEWNE